MPRRNKSKVKGLTQTQQKSVKKLAKEVAMKIPERKVFGFNGENIQLIHNKVSYLDNWLKCKQGITDPDDQSSQLARIGDELMLRNINIRFWLSNKDDRPNCMYKLYLFWYDSGMTLDDAYCYFTAGNKMLDRTNNENISVIDQQTIFSGPQYTDKEHSYLCTLKASWKGKKITYDEGGAIPKKRTLGTMVVAYDAYGTLQSDNIASYAYNGIVTIQDA